MCTTCTLAVHPNCTVVPLKLDFKLDSAHFCPLFFCAGSGRVNLVPLPPVVTSPRDMALAAVICSALATVLLALLVLCVIYCKRQLLEKKPSGEWRCNPNANVLTPALASTCGAKRN